MKVEYLDHMGSDLDVVNAARVSFDKASDYETRELFSEADARNYAIKHRGYILEPDFRAEGDDYFAVFPVKVLSGADQILIRFLALGMTQKDFGQLISQIMRMAEAEDREAIGNLLRKVMLTPTHWAPFAHCMVKFRVTAPVAIARQLWKSHIGLASQDEPIGWSEVSRRYVDHTPHIHAPDMWRQKADNKKQGSQNIPVDPDLRPEVSYSMAAQASVQAYEILLDDNACPEQSRFALLQGAETTWVWTGSLIAFARICAQRLDDHAQLESQQIAKEISAFMNELFPVSWDELLKGL